MKKIKHRLYEDYPNHPYISPERDLIAWENFPEKFPYNKVERKQMERVEEGLLPGDIVLLWRISLNTFTTEATIPDYFEYRYGIEASESLEFLINEGYARKCSAEETLSMMNMVVLKRIAKHHKIDLKGKKEELLQRINVALSEADLEPFFDLRKYEITDLGTELLKKYNDVIQKHGPKM